MSLDNDHLEDQLRRRFTRRMFLVGAAQAGLVGVLGHRLHQLQVVQQENYAFLSDNNRLSVQPLPPVRGTITDRFGQVLAANRDENGLMIVPDLAGDVQAVLETLRDFIPIPEPEFRRIVTLSKRQSRILPIDIEVTLDWETLARINVEAPHLPGIQTTVRKKRVYGAGTEFGHILGYVGRVSKFEPGQDPALRLSSMREGKSGVEGGLENRLRGVGGSVKHEVNARGQIVRKLDHVPAKTGDDIQLSIDSALQAKTMRHVARFGRASAVVLDVNTGEILSMASAPSYDPGDIVAGISPKAWSKLRNDPGKPLMNRAIRGQYPPGSTVKMVTALAALDAGLITPDEKFTCRGSYEFQGHKFGCWNRGGHGRVNLHRAIRESCDVYFYRIAERMGIEKLAETARRFGLGETFDTGLAGEKAGVVPDRAWKLFTLERPWVPGETLHSGIGQGYVLSTPLQLATMTARLATGRKVTPTIEKVSARNTDGPPPSLGFEDAWLKKIHRAMFAVVNERGGTGHTAALGWPGVYLAGKTGTSQVSKASRHRRNKDLKFELRDHSLFVAFAPARDPKYAIATIVDHGGGGSVAAAPLARNIMSDVLSMHFARRGETPNKGSAGTVTNRKKVRKTRKRTNRLRRRSGLSRRTRVQ